jgi:hypothetical protein
MNRALPSTSSTAAPRTWIFRAALALLAAAPLLALPGTANAACGRFGALASNDSIKLPSLPHSDIGFPAPILPGSFPVVGLWHVIYSTGSGSDTAIFNDTFDTWHGDGTEFESAFLAPLGGNVCAGVWRPTGDRSVTLHHVGWMFDPSTPAATASNTFTLDENVSVSRDGQSYSGSFTFKIWNLDGSFTGTEVTGSIAATRINPN